MAIAVHEAAAPMGADVPQAGNLVILAAEEDEVLTANLDADGLVPNLIRQQSRVPVFSEPERRNELANIVGVYPPGRRIRRDLLGRSDGLIFNLNHRGLLQRPALRL